jgi:hypothetical protein
MTAIANRPNKPQHQCHEPGQRKSQAAVPGFLLACLFALGAEAENLNNLFRRRIIAERTTLAAVSPSCDGTQFRNGEKRRHARVMLDCLFKLRMTPFPIAGVSRRR